MVYKQAKNQPRVVAPIGEGGGGEEEEEEQEEEEEVTK